MSGGVAPRLALIEMLLASKDTADRHVGWRRLEAIGGGAERDSCAGSALAHAGDAETIAEPVEIARRRAPDWSCALAVQLPFAALIDLPGVRDALLAAAADTTRDPPSGFARMAVEEARGHRARRAQDVRRALTRGRVERELRVGPGVLR